MEPITTVTSAWSIAKTVGGNIQKAVRVPHSVMRLCHFIPDPPAKSGKAKGRRICYTVPAMAVRTCRVTIPHGGFRPNVLPLTRNRARRARTTRRTSTIIVTKKTPAIAAAQ